MSNYKDFDLGSIEASPSGMDAFFDDSPSPKVAAKGKPTSKKASGRTKKASGRTKVASIEQLGDFVRTGSDTLIHKSDKDLWSLQKDANGEYFIERMFEDGDPVKG